MLTNPGAFRQGTLGRFASEKKPPVPTRKDTKVIDLDSRRIRSEEADAEIEAFRSRLMSRFGCPKCGCKDPEFLLTDLSGTILACVKCGFGT